MIFLDTSGIIALAMPTDIYHTHALSMMQSADSDGAVFLLHNYVIVEAMALLQRRIGLDAAMLFMRSTELFHVVWVDAEMHTQAVNTLGQSAKSQLSLVDVVSFQVMRKHECHEFIGFNKHFLDAGFASYQG